MDRLLSRQINRQMDRLLYRQIFGLKDSWINRQKDRWTDRQLYTEYPKKTSFKDFQESLDDIFQNWFEL